MGARAAGALPSKGQRSEAPTLDTLLRSTRIAPEASADRRLQRGCGQLSAWTPTVSANPQVR